MTQLNLSDRECLDIPVACVATTGVEIQVPSFTGFLAIKIGEQDCYGIWIDESKLRPQS